MHPQCKLYNFNTKETKLNLVINNLYSIAIRLGQSQKVRREKNSFSVRARAKKKLGTRVRHSVGHIVFRPKGHARLIHSACAHARRADGQRPPCWMVIAIGDLDLVNRRTARRNFIIQYKNFQKTKQKYFNLLSIHFYILTKVVLTH